MPVSDQKFDVTLLIGNIKIPNICAKLIFNTKQSIYLLGQ